MIYKKISVLLSTMALTTMVYAQQPPQGTAGGGAFWRLGGNFGGLGSPNIFGTATGNNNPIYTQTNGVTRMTLMGTNPPGSISGALGLGTILPQSYLHLSNFGTGAFTANGELFRTTGNESVTNNWRMYTGNKFGNTEKFRITSLIGLEVNSIELGAVQNGTLNFLTNNIQRVTILGDNAAPYVRNGFVGFNNNNPLFHLDINTPNPQGTTWGELLLRARIVDDPDSYISFVNIATVGTVFVPTLLARQSDNPAGALTTIGSINSNQDLAVNAVPITRFFSAINYDPSIDPPTLALARANVVENRRLFGWYNGVDQLMTMESNGFLGVATTNPGNRVEINSDFYDATTGNPLGTAGSGPLVTATTNNGQPGLGGTNATGFSGLRFSDLKSTSNPYLSNPGPGVLAVDQNGDVIYVNASGVVGGGSFSGAHNGTSMSILDPTKVSFGNDVGQTIGQLLNDREVPLNNNNIVFTDNNAVAGNGKNRIGVGTSNPSARFHITVNNLNSESSPVGLIVENNQTTSNGFAIGENINVSGTNTVNSGQNITISGATVNLGLDASTTGGNENTGVFGRATDGTISNTGVVAEAVSNTISANNNTGIRAQAVGGLYNSGGSFQAGSNTPSLNSHGVYTVAAGYGLNNYGIYTQASQGVNNYGIYSETNYLPTTFAGFFIGNVHVEGSITASGSITPSDQQFKTNIQNLSGAMNLINQLQPRTYDLDTANFSDFAFESDQQMGLVAQELEQIIPTIVSTHIRPAQYDSLGTQTSPEVSYKGVEYEELIPLLIAGMQEQDARIDSLTSINNTVNNNNDSLEQIVSDLNARLTQLENCLSNILPALCNANSMAVQSTPAETQEHLEKAINVTLSNRYNIVLNQNVPNPFAESTIITYSIPVTVQKAQIHFYDGTGKLINSVDIIERGNGQLNVFANDLSTGVYTYSLVADGQIASTKRMMKQ